VICVHTIGTKEEDEDEDGEKFWRKIHSSLWIEGWWYCGVNEEREERDL
jgi:hypothetical protein